MGSPWRSLFLIAASTIAGLALGTIIELPADYSRTAPWTELVGLGLEDLKETDCIRPCVSGEPPRVCLFTFILEHYAAMGTACGNCSKGVLEDCFRSQCIPADGHERGVMSVNRKIPGPPIHVCRNDLIVINVTNRMTGTGSTLHWHGIWQKHTPSMDGVPRTTQCPIGSGEVFTYIFPVEDSGTFFYHSHTGEQKMNGHYGALIVREQRSYESWCEDVYSSDLLEHTVVLSDWMHDYAEMFLPGLPTKQPGIRPTTLLLNGLGRYLDDPDSEASFNLSAVPLATFHVGTDESYRFRFINAATMLCPIQIQVQDHNMTLIATDGQAVAPVIVDAVVTYPGERYDLVINTYSDETLKKNAFWIHIRGLGECEYQYKLDQYGVLSYGTNISDLGIIPEGYRPTIANPLPITTILNHPNTTCGASPYGLCVTDLKSVEVYEEDDDVLTAEPDVRIFVRFGYRFFDNVDDFHSAGTYQRFENPGGDTIRSAVMNNISFTFLPTPTIFTRDRDPGFCTPNKLPSRCQSSDNSTTPYCICTYAETVKENDIVELTLIDGSPIIRGNNHAFHLHGFGFYVTRIEQDLSTSSGYTVDEVREILDQDSDARGICPPIKDTVSVPSKGFVTLRFRANNPGEWLLHCHFDTDAIGGMVMLLRVEGELPELPPGFPRCGSFNPLLSP